MKLNEIYLGNCLEIMKQIDNGSIDVILADLPYGVTKNNKDIKNLKVGNINVTLKYWYLYIDTI